MAIDRIAIFASLVVLVFVGVCMIKIRINGLGMNGPGRFVLSGSDAPRLPFYVSLASGGSSRLDENSGSEGLRRRPRDYQALEALGESDRVGDLISRSRSLRFNSLCRHLGIGDTIFYEWKTKCAHLDRR